MFPLTLSKLCVFIFSLITISTIHRIVNRSHTNPDMISPKITYPDHTSPILTKKMILHSAFGMNSFVSPTYIIKPIIMNKNNKNKTYEMLKRSMFL